MKNMDMNGRTADLFTETTDLLKARKFYNKVIDGAELFGMTKDQFVNIRTERTPITPVQFEMFLRKVKELDEKYIYRWLVDQLLP